MTRPGSTWLLLAGCALVAASAALAGPPPMPNRHQMKSLYIIDHSGNTPVDPTELIAYSVPFQKILAGCKTDVTSLTMMMINLSQQASDVGARTVTSLDMLESVAGRITWKKPRSCDTIYNIAEAHREAGHF